MVIMSSDTRERILKETWRLMEKDGNARLEDIAKAAKVSRQAIYLHFYSRPELLIATVRYVDEVLNLSERIRQACAMSNGVMSINAFVEFWANYIPDIYGLAKALLKARETDEAAAAAWDDRMKALYNGCRIVIQCLERDQSLAPGWTIDEATDFFWSILAISHWENLTIERGWTKEQYIQRTQEILKAALVKPEASKIAGSF